MGVTQLHRFHRIDNRRRPPAANVAVRQISRLTVGSFVLKKMASASFCFIKDASFKMCVPSAASLRRCAFRMRRLTRPVQAEKAARWTGRWKNIQKCCPALWSSASEPVCVTASLIKPLLRLQSFCADSRLEHFVPLTV